MVSAIAASRINCVKCKWKQLYAPEVQNNYAVHVACKNIVITLNGEPTADPMVLKYFHKMFETNKKAVYLFSFSVHNLQCLLEFLSFISSVKNPIYEKNWVLHPSYDQRCQDVDGLDVRRFLSELKILDLNFVMNIAL